MEHFSHCYPTLPDAALGRTDGRLQRFSPVRHGQATQLSYGSVRVAVWDVCVGICQCLLVSVQGCAYMCICVCMPFCVYLCIVSVHCAHTCLFMCGYTHLCLETHACLHVCPCAFTSMHTHYLHICICAYVCTFTPVCVCTCVYSRCMVGCTLGMR